MFILSLRFCQS